MGICGKFSGFQQTSPHRDRADFNACAIPVGAGLPAKRPVQAYIVFIPAAGPHFTFLPI
ncbi:hypothetical protein RK21_04138 [Pseudomonas plecoglossicida]|nr:hypothetical protein RK21_04138 [Pseudomonas plecoglossicida]